jgi:Ser/Thr protein kinase RdoA (MazF antagonist)
LRDVVVSKEGLVVRVFPADDKLGYLQRWMCATDRDRFFLERPALRPLAGITRCSMLNYKPERRWVGRLDDADGRAVAVLKVHTASGFETAHAAARGIRDGNRFAVPRLLGKSRRRSTLILGWRDGLGLEERMQGGGLEEGDLEEVGRGLAEFHCQLAPDLREIRRDERIAPLADHARVIGGLVPRLAEHASRLAPVLAAGVGALPAPMVVLHGDFYAKQVVRVSGGVVFLDLDSAHRGPAWIDLANFLAHLELDVIRGRIPHGAASLAAESLVAGYERQAQEAVPRGLPQAVAAALFSQAVHCFRSREPDWDVGVEQVLSRTEGLLVQSDRRRGILGNREEPREKKSALTGGAKSAVAQGIPDDPQLPFLRQALDPAQMESRFRKLNALERERLMGMSLVSATLLRHKLGRRCLIEYRFHSVTGDEACVWLGKMRSRRGRALGLQVARDLRAAGLTEDSEVAVPEPVGEIPEWPMDLQQRVAGDDLFRCLVGGDAVAVSLSVRCARAISRLHGSGVTVPRNHTLAEELAILRDRWVRLEADHPRLAGRLRRVLVDCERLADGTPEGPCTLVHRDYYPDQVLVEGARLWLLDLDLCAMGDPCVDHGNFLAHMQEWSLRRHGTLDALHGCVEGYRAAALAAVGTEGERRLEAWQTLALVRQVSLCTQFVDRRHLMPVLLELSERRLAGHLATVGVAL